MMMKVYRDSSGRVINIGPWDYVEIPQIKDETGENISIILNPLPESSTCQEEEVIYLEDGGLAALNP